MGQGLKFQLWATKRRHAVRSLVGSVFAVLLLSASPSWPQSDPTPSEDEVQALLAVCEEHFAADRLLFGEEGTATECFNAVLELDPTNADATAGLVRIIDKYDGWARREIERQNWENAQVYLQRMETVNPDDPRVFGIRSVLAAVERLETESADADFLQAEAPSSPPTDTVPSEDDEIQVRLEECEEHFAADRLLFGEEGTANECFKEVLAQDPTNADAAAGLVRIIDKYEGWARREIERRNWENAQVYLERMESVNPDDPRVFGIRSLLAAIERLETESADADSLQVESLSSPQSEPGPSEDDDIQALLMVCEEHFAADRLLVGEEGTATECFKDVLARDPANVAATEGLVRIIDKYEVWARRAVEREDLQSVRSYLERMETVNPGDPRVSEFRSLLAAIEQPDAEPADVDTLVAEAQSDPTPSEDDGIRALLSVCEEHFAADRLLFGEVGTANECFKEVLGLDPTNADAAAGLARIIDKYEAWARREIQRENWQNVQVYLDRMESVNPDDPRVSEFRSVLAAIEQPDVEPVDEDSLQAEAPSLPPTEPEPGVETDPTPSEDAEIQALLLVCEEHFAADRLLVGDEGTATECFKEVLTRDPTNAAATEGLVRINDKYEVWARRALEREDLPSVRSYIERMETVNPDDPRVSEFRSVLVAIEQPDVEPVDGDSLQAEGLSSPGTDPDPSGETEPSPGENDEIQALLLVCEVHFVADRLLVGDEGTATECFKEVLARDPTNAAATEGLVRINDKYEVWARRAIEREDLPSVRSYIERMETVNPDDPRVPEFRSLLAAIEQPDGDSLQAEAQSDPTPSEDAEIQALLLVCEEHFAADRLLVGDEGTATECFKEVLTRDPTNAAATEGLVRINDKYEVWARRALEREDLPSVRSYIERMETVNPDDPRVSEFRSVLVAIEQPDGEPVDGDSLQAEAPSLPPTEPEPGVETDPTPSEDAEIQALLSVCEEHFAADRLLVGEDGTATTCFKEVLVRDPTNAAATEGLVRINDKYEVWARRALEREDLPSVRSYLERMETVNPDDPRVSEFRSVLVAIEQPDGEPVDGDSLQAEAPSLPPTEPEPSVETDPTPSEDAEIQALLLVCEEHFAADRLLVGEDGTATACFKEVLARDPANAAATEGLVRINDKYEVWARRALEGEDLESARSYLERMETVNLDDPRVSEIRSLLAAVEQPDSDPGDADSLQAEAVSLPQSDPEPNEEADPTPSEDDEIRALLSVCEEHVAADRLLFGDEGTATECFKEVLALDPTNAAAAAGLVRIIDNYDGWARRAIESENLQDARVYLERMETVNRNDPRVSEIRSLLAAIEQPDAERADADSLRAEAPSSPQSDPVPSEEADPTPSQEDELQALLLSCEEHFAADRLLVGDEGTATECFKEVLARDPTNSDASAGLRRIIGRYEEWARRAIESENLQDARVYLERMETVNPDDPRVSEIRSLLAAVEQPDAEPADADSRTAKTLSLPPPDSGPSEKIEILALLLACEDHFAADRLLFGDEGNATACFNEVLVRDPTNADAAAGLARVVQKYEGWARREIERQNWQKARSYLERMETVNRADPRVFEISYLLAAIERLDAESRNADFRRARLALTRGDYEAAAGFLQGRADDGHPAAQFELGAMHHHAFGMPRDGLEAARLYRLAAEQGHPEAQAALGVAYQTGSIVLRNVSEAAKWYRLAAEQGHVDARAALGQMLYFGLGVPQDFVEARKWSHLAAYEGNHEASLLLGEMYARGQGVVPDIREALRWYQLSVDQGSPEAPVFVGLMYGVGQGVRQDFVRAYAYFLLARPEGDARAVTEQLRRDVRALLSPSEISRAKALSLQIRDEGHRAFSEFATE